MGTPILKIYEWNGAQIATNKTPGTVRFKAADDATVDTVNPLTIPGAGRTYSYEKWLRLAVGSGDRADSISNIKFYTDGTNSFGSGVSLYAEVNATRSFRSVIPGDTALTTPLGGSGSRTMTNAFSYTSGGALSLTSAAESYSGTSTNIGAYAILMMGVVPGATSGTLSSETLSISYDTSAAAVTSTNTKTTDLHAMLRRSGATKTSSLDSIIGKAVDDSGFGCVVAVERDFPQDEFLDNDFTAIDFSASNSFIQSVTGFVNGSATVSGGVVTFVATVSGTAAFHYVGNYHDTIMTGSVGLTATAFPDEALVLNLAILVDQALIIDFRSGTTRSTGLDSNQQIVSYLSGEERYTATLERSALGLLIEDTGVNSLTNSNLSGAALVGWSSITDGTRSATASLLGNADGATAYVFVAAPVSGGGPGGRPYLQQVYTWSASTTYCSSFVIEYYTGAPTGVIANVLSVGSALSTLSGVTQLSAGQISTVPHFMSMKFITGDMSAGVSTGFARYGPGVTTSTSATMIISRPVVERGKSARSSFSPDMNRPGDRPTISVSPTDFPMNTGAGAFIMQGRTAPYGGTQVFWQIDDGTQNNRHRVYRDISSNLHYTITDSATDKVDMIWSAVANDTDFRLGLSYDTNDVRGQLNSSTDVLTDTLASLPNGLTTLRFGHDISGNYWNGTMAEFNVFRTTRDFSGGTTTTNPNVIPLNYYGVGHACTSLGNTALNIAGRMVSYRFRCVHTGALTGIKWYDVYNNDPGRSGYNRYLGSNANGPGGNIRIRVQTNNPNAGAAGTGANVPTTTVLGNFDIFSAHDAQTPYPEISGSANLSASGIYHITFENIHSDPGDNFISTDQLNQSWDPTPHNPQIPDLFEETMYRNTAVNTWTRRPQTHILQLRYSDGILQGSPYVAINISSGDQGRVNVGGATQLRQSFKPPSTINVTQFNIWGRKTTSGAPVVCTIKQQSNGFVMDTLSVSPSLFVNAPGASDGWVSKNTNSTLTFSGSITYTFTLTATSGAYGFATLQDGSEQVGWNSAVSTEGYCQISTNSGSSFTGFDVNNRTNTQEADLMFYFLKV